MSVLGVIPLAKKSAPRPAAPAPEAEPAGRPKQPLAVQVRGRPEWKRWVKDLATANRQDVASLVDTALARMAREIGFREPPMR